MDLRKELIYGFLSGGGNSLVQRIDTWQSTGSVFAGGIPAALWSGAVNSGGNAAGRTFINPAYAICQDGEITGFSFYASARLGNTSIRLKVFRYNTGTTQYDYVSQSEDFNGENSTGVKGPFTLAAPLAVQMGDIIGFFIPTATGGIGLSNARITKGRYVNGDIVTSNAFTLTLDTSPEIEVYMKQPYLAITGDSIPEGHNGATAWHGWLHDVAVPVIPGGTVTSEPGNQLKALLPTLKYQNMALGSQTYAWVASTGIVKAIATDANTILIHCGVNDVATARAWASTEADLDTIIAAVNAATPIPRLLIDEIMPWTAGDDTEAALVRTFNANLAIWCAANGATLVRCHDAMGQVRASTGELDDMITAYNQDGVHLSAAGVNALVAIWKQNL